MNRDKSKLENQLQHVESRRAQAEDSLKQFQQSVGGLTHHEVEASILKKNILFARDSD